MPLTLATPAQLRARMQNPALPDDVAAQAIADASALVRATAGQAYDYVENDTVDLTAGETNLVLPQRPVVVDGAYPLTVLERLYHGVNVWSPALIEGYNYVRLGTVLHRYYRPWSQVVRVTYTHGYQVAPDWLTSLVLDVALTYATNPQGLRSETVGQITQVWARESLRATSDLSEMVKERLTAIGELSRSFTIRTAL